MIIWYESLACTKLSKVSGNRVDYNFKACKAVVNESGKYRLTE